MILTVKPDRRKASHLLHYFCRIVPSGLTLAPWLAGQVAGRSSGQDPYATRDAETPPFLQRQPYSTESSFVAQQASVSQIVLTLADVKTLLAYTAKY